MATTRPPRPRPAAIRRSIWERNLSDYAKLFNNTSYDHLLFDLHALNTYTHQFGEKALPLIPKRQSTFARHVRHTILNVYRRLFSVVVLVNLVGLYLVLMYTDHWETDPPLSIFATAAAANITVAIMIRQDYIINILYKTLWLVPISASLSIRATLAKVYEFGGIHSGSAICSVLWFILLTVFMTIQFVQRSMADVAVLSTSYILLALLISIVVTAYPVFRFRAHNTFEAIHRWAGWFSLALFWAEIILFARLESQADGRSLGSHLVRLAPFWLLAISTLHTILPWLRLHKLQVLAETPSSHVVRLHFSEPIPLFVGIRVSEHPLGEWHSFACIPNRDGGKSGGSILISNAGDWTKRTIRHPKKYYWVKGVPVTGVLCVARVFRSVVIVTTGSGIGPCLGVMQDIPNTKVRVIWSTRDPWQTYGKEVCHDVLKVDRHAEIIDTRFVRRPDLVSIAYQVYHLSGAEAVLVISNPKLTRKVVYGMETRGVPAFGPIWDS